MGLALNLLIQTALISADQTVLLQPASPALLRIDFNFNFGNELPPFPKEPVLTGKEVSRGLIPTFPPTPLLRNISENLLLLNTDHSRDFVNGRVGTYRSTYRGHVIFQDLGVTTGREGVEIPYTLDLFTYEHGCAGWVHVKSGWEGTIAVWGQKWRLGIMDNLDGRIGESDILCLRREPAEPKERPIEITPVPRQLFLDGHAFDLGFVFKAAGTGAVLEATLTETNFPLGNINIAATGCRFVRLGNKQLTAVLDSRAVTNLVPAGTYNIEDCVLDVIPGMFRQPSFIRCGQKITVKPGKTASLEIGPPLRNTVQVTRDRNALRLTYQLLGRAGEQYEYYNWRDRPRFAVYKGPFELGGGALPFG